MGRLFGDGTTGRLRESGRSRLKRTSTSRPVCRSCRVERCRGSDIWPCWFANGSCRRTSGRKWRRLSLPLAARLGGFWSDLGLLRSDELLPAVRRHYGKHHSLAIWLDRWPLQIEPGMTAGPERTRCFCAHPAVWSVRASRVVISTEKIAAHVGSGNEPICSRRIGQLG